MSTEEWQRTFDELLDALAHIQRRTLLCALLEHNLQDDKPVEVDANESATEELAHLVEMRHVHFHKLDAYGFITWNSDTNEVSKGPNFDEIQPLLEIFFDHEDDLSDGWL